LLKYVFGFMMPVVNKFFFKILFTIDDLPNHKFGVDEELEE
jgi:hypothetical protein